MATIGTVGLIVKPDTSEAEVLVPQVVEWLESRQVKVRLDGVAAGYLPGSTGLLRDEVPDGCELIVVMGGDGTLLSASRAIRGREIPLLAINLGGLGFLTAISTSEVIPELERALRNEHRIAKRRLLECRVERGDEVVARYEALNDCVVTTASLARMIDLDAYIDEQFVCRYKADGLIVSTPTGSTAYSLSAGGPIIFPSVAALCLTPICPHTLTNRPVLVSDTSVICIRTHAARGQSYLTIDGQVGRPLEEGDQIRCRMSEKALHLIRPPRMRYFDVLRSKLKWGER